jgi:hypothetical protein
LHKRMLWAFLWRIQMGPHTDWSRNFFLANESSEAELIWETQVDVLRKGADLWTKKVQSVTLTFLCWKAVESHII